MTKVIETNGDRNVVELDPAGVYGVERSGVMVVRTGSVDVARRIAADEELCSLAVVTLGLPAVETQHPVRRHGRSSRNALIIGFGILFVYIGLLWFVRIHLHWN